MSGWWLYPLLGACAGVFAGLLGIGGGLVLVAALAWLLPLQGVPADVAMHVALASSMASIVLTAGTEGTEALKKEIQEYVKTHTAPYKYPRIVVFRDELPKTISGKIMRRLL